MSNLSHTSRHTKQSQYIHTKHSLKIHALLPRHTHTFIHTHAQPFKTQSSIHSQTFVHNHSFVLIRTRTHSSAFIRIYSGSNIIMLSKNTHAYTQTNSTHCVATLGFACVEKTIQTNSDSMQLGQATNMRHAQIQKTCNRKQRTE